MFVVVCCLLLVVVEGLGFRVSLFYPCYSVYLLTSFTLQPFFTLQLFRVTLLTTLTRSKAPFPLFTL